MKKIISISVLIAVIILTLTAIPAVISADPGTEYSLEVSPGCNTELRIHASEGFMGAVILWVFKFAGSWEELYEIGNNSSGEGVFEYMVYGTITNETISPDDEGVFIIDSDDRSRNVNLKLSPGHYFAFAIFLPMFGEQENIVREFTVSGCNEEEEEDEIIPWVRDVEMTCYQVWINESNNFEFVFWWEYANNNWVKIYDMQGNEVFSIDMPKGNARFEANLPDGMYTVKTFHDDMSTSIQEFVIGKP
jgi:hypothetical protein